MLILLDNFFSLGKISFVWTYAVLCISTEYRKKRRFCVKAPEGSEFFSYYFIDAVNYG